MNLTEAAARYGYAVRTSKRTPDRYWLVDLATGQLASPTTGESFDQIEPTIRAAEDREGTNLNLT